MKSKRFKVRVFMFLLALCLIGASLAYKAYVMVLASNVQLEVENKEIFIPEKSTVEEVAFLLDHSSIIKDKQSFLFVSKLKKFKMPSKGGKYLIQKGWSNNDIINSLRIGSEIPVNLTFNNIRTPEDLSARIASQLALDSTEMMEYFNDYEFIRSLGFDFETIICIFIPNTYHVYWSISTEDLFKRMKREYDAFWNTERMALSKQIGYSPTEIMTLASIVDEESSKAFEKKTIAGVYINRLYRGIPLQADPTLKFAVGDASIKRILNEHKKVESPYNTYKYKGLPPGPIRIPDAATIDAVLNYKRHKYLYFCAKDDFSGSHSFSKTLKQHNAYARRYHNALNKRRIYK